MNDKPKVDLFSTQFFPELLIIVSNNLFYICAKICSISNKCNISKFNFLISYPKPSYS